ncbi:P-loop containing nucleoside triphosphate hydrolase protein [Marasmius fiardii PR-910]|nr:P-loop containing nucleoside triphosphate hydrolase protein [Marasmius fiardii PR-910]
MILPDYSDISTTHLNVAIEHVQKAIEYDMNHRYSRACIGYLESLPHFLLAFKQERNVGMRSLLAQKMKEYSDRIDVLKRKPLMGVDAATSSNGLVRRISVPPGFPGSKGEYDTDHGQDGPSLCVPATVKRNGCRAALQSRTGTSVTHQSHPKVLWSDILGHEITKNALKEGIVLPLKFPHLFKNSRIRFPRTLMLYGPPGSGKKMLVEALVADLAGFCKPPPRFVTFSCVDVVMNGTPKEEIVASLNEAFQTGVKTENSGSPVPTVILIDGPEALYTHQDRETDRLRLVRTELLYHIDQSRNVPGVFVIMTSRAPWELNAVLKKRFRKSFYVMLPGQEERMEMFKRLVGRDPEGNSNQLSESEYVKLGEMTKGYSGQDIVMITLDARIQSLKRNLVAAVQGNEGRLSHLPEEESVPRSPSFEDFMISLTGMRPIGVVDSRYEWTKSV